MRKKDSFGRCTRARSWPTSGATVLEARCFSTTLNGAPNTTSLTDAIFTKRMCLRSAEHQEQETITNITNKYLKKERT